MFTPHTSLGALLLYAGADALLTHTGRVFGISSLLAGSLHRPDADNLSVISGLAASALPVYLFAPGLIPSYPLLSRGSIVSAVVLGALLGWGTKNGRGCTSGHMLCGVSRLSPRSLIATAIFFSVGLLTANIGHLLGANQFNHCKGFPCYTPVYPSSPELGFMLVTAVLAPLVNALVPRIFKRQTKSQPRSATTLVSFLAGLEFGLGLFITGMADPAKVRAFFAFLADPSRFDPSLALVIVFGILPLMVSYHKSTLVKKENHPPTLTDSWSLPTATVQDIDWRFVAGAAVFGLAWGWSGVCPGPAILRSVLQPSWGVCAMAGYMLGSW
ncbi:hypothetical protein ASPZODRAFT_18173 [Penicilliopsis zonata CBS 506.65]|uniref:Sulphur transport domain-containing protein n=1 Tax=Penicilliopsis zonata CBS 506.65 TaxID=1073090 RepID=A0A1L9SBX9_9EURO|nr:hypothetical protein ASPZODRAFT_18173 [Penicilliopsis zonata CBS 506.65]OJJ44597.1 hypothetical protein ASPZODRAFT_18173 [Penicilliopsis zonata CBS 506.65]